MQIINLYKEKKKRKEKPLSTRVRFFFPLHSKNKLQLLLISKIHPFYLFEKKNVFLNYNRYKLLTFIQKK